MHRSMVVTLVIDHRRRRSTARTQATLVRLGRGARRACRPVSRRFRHRTSRIHINERRGLRVATSRWVVEPRWGRPGAMTGYSGVGLQQTLVGQRRGSPPRPPFGSRPTYRFRLLGGASPVALLTVPRPSSQRCALVTARTVVGHSPHSFPGAQAFQELARRAARIPSARSTYESGPLFRPAAHACVCDQEPYDTPTEPPHDRNCGARAREE